MSKLASTVVNAFWCARWIPLLRARKVRRVDALLKSAFVKLHADAVDDTLTLVEAELNDALVGADEQADGRPRDGLDLAIEIVKAMREDE